MFNLFNVAGRGCTFESHKRGECQISEDCVATTIVYGINDIFGSYDGGFSRVEYSREGRDYFIVPIKNFAQSPCGHVWIMQDRDNYCYWGVEYSGVGAAVFKFIIQCPALFYGYLQAEGKHARVDSANIVKIDPHTFEILSVLRGDGKPFFVHNDPDVDLAAMADMVDKRVAELFSI